ncbi:2TM domain-containing protein [Chryseobacterium zhengzhouense]|uniref:2TM domain-containing protein n=1 Tax=Chryseobacterium zhengzhouense TaxID=1636086 RepID=A0ABW2M1A4_9FLAO
MENNQQNIRYREAVKRVKKLKGFYIHLMVFCFVNIFIIIAKALSLDAGEKFWEWDLLKLPFFWGIGLLAHGLSVFLPSMILGSNWEEKKIKELMEKNK